jgi:hypothetical protein
MVVNVALYWALGVAVAALDVAAAVQVIAAAPITETVDEIEKVHPVISTLTVAGVDKPGAVPSPSWATPHSGINDIPPFLPEYSCAAGIPVGVE